MIELTADLKRKLSEASNRYVDKWRVSRLSADGESSLIVTLKNLETAHLNGAYFGFEAGVRAAIETIRSDEVELYADKYFDNNNCLPEPVQLADFLEQHFGLKESSECIK